MKKGWILVIVLFLIIIVGLVVLFMLPSVSNAPTTSRPGTATTTATSTNVGQSALVDLIEVDQPSANTQVASPLTIAGKARGSWYFEATAPVVLKDAAGVVIAHGTIRATGNWMTTDFVPFVGTLSFTAPATHTGTLVLQNDNPSGDPKKAKELDIPVVF